MLIVSSAVAVAALAGLTAYALARRWPEPIEAAHLEAQTIVAEVEVRPRIAGFLQHRRDPTRLTGLALTGALALIVGGAVGIGLLLTMVKKHRGLATWDLAFTRFGEAHASTLSTTFLRDLSLLGSYPGVVIIGVLLVAIELPRTRPAALIAFVVLALGGQFAIAEAVKGLVGRDRPDVLHLTGFSGSSFPSGHATAAAATFMSAALLLGRRRTAHTKALLAATAIGLASAVAATRVLLGVHWFTDVLAGLLLGWAWFACCSIAFGGRLLRFATPVDQAELAENTSTTEATI